MKIGSGFAGPGKGLILTGGPTASRPTSLYSTPFLTGTPEGIPMTINNNNELFFAYSVQSGGSPANIFIGYKGITIDRNSYVTDYLQRLKFPNIKYDLMKKLSALIILE